MRLNDDIMEDVLAEKIVAKKGDIYNKMYSDRTAVQLPTTQILEGSIVYAYKGQAINLTCYVHYNYDKCPKTITWYRQDDVSVKLSKILVPYLNQGIQ